MKHRLLLFLLLIQISWAQQQVSQSGGIFEQCESISKLSPGIRSSGNAISSKKRITPPFGWTENPIFHTPQFHVGIDYAIAFGTAICPSTAGVVEAARKGAAKVGSTGLSTGPHLPYEERFRGIPINKYAGYRQPFLNRLPSRTKSSAPHCDAQFTKEEINMKRISTRLMFAATLLPLAANCQGQTSTLDDRTNAPSAQVATPPNTPSPLKPQAQPGCPVPPVKPPRFHIPKKVQDAINKNAKKLSDETGVDIDPNAPAKAVKEAQKESPCPPAASTKSVPAANAPAKQ